MTGAFSTATLLQNLQQVGRSRGMGIRPRMAASPAMDQLSASCRFHSLQSSLCSELNDRISAVPYAYAPHCKGPCKERQNETVLLMAKL